MHTYAWKLGLLFSGQCVGVYVNVCTRHQLKLSLCSLHDHAKDVLMNSRSLCCLSQALL